MNSTHKPGLFIRIPKTASTSLLSAMPHTQLRVSPHPNPNISDFSGVPDGLIYANTGSGGNAFKVVSDNFDADSFFTFCFVRNPYERAVSSWKFGAHRSSWNCSFEDFLKTLKNSDLDASVLGDRRPWHSKLLHACKQYPFVSDGNKSVDYIGRCENLIADVKIICDKLGVDCPIIPDINRTKHKHYSHYYDSRTRDLVCSIYQQDIDSFGYEFE